MQTALWWAQLLFASWLFAGALVFLAVASSATEGDGNFWWGALVPPTLALAFIVCPTLPIWYGLVAGVLALVAVGHVWDASMKIRGFETTATSVLAVSAATAWLPWAATALAFVAWQLAKEAMNTKLESLLVPHPDDV